jgi:peptidoglycan/xylan/chitin deacetylase (PgdA/CDA1 family)
MVVGHLAGRRAALRRRADLPQAVVLTFDDGPNPEATPAFLECLAQHDVPAAFFLVGRRAKQSPELAREIPERGHEVGNHTYSHRHQWTLSPRGTAAEIRRGTEAIAEASGRTPIAFRPPWGIFNALTASVARGLGQRSVLWSVRSEGFRWRPSAEEMADHVVAHTRGGDIIDLHDAGGFPDTPTRVLAALPLIIERLRAAGFRFARLSEFL